MLRVARTRLAGILIVALLVQTGWVAPATATSQASALTACAHHCKRMRSLADAGRCCGVDASAAQPARLSAAKDLDAPAPALLAMVPAERPPVLAPAEAARASTVAHAATGPPRFLRLQTLLL